MFTLGYKHTPWQAFNPIAPGAQIRNYVKSVAKQFGIDKHISYQKQLISANYSTQNKTWNLEIKDNEKNTTLHVTCNVLEMCTGYYDYENPFRPKFNGETDFKGDIIHPQHWDENYNYEGKKIVIIGSGATGVTLLPSLCDKAKSVTMLQRSPTYIISLPQYNPVNVFFQRVLPSNLAYSIIRAENIFLNWSVYVICRAFPSIAKKILLKGVKYHLPEFVFLFFFDILFVF